MAGGAESCISHDEVTLALAKIEAAEHFHGMQELYDEMRLRPLRIKVFPLDHQLPGDSNVKVVHFVRHGQGFHNLMADLYHGAGRKWTQYTHSEDNPYIMPEITDAPLTDKGRQQAAALQETVRGLDDQPELVVLSPNCRALQTGVIVFDHLREKNIPFIAHEMVREENGVHVCDKRRPVRLSSREFPMVDFSLLEDDEDTIFRDDRRENKMEIGERIYKFFEFLHTREEKHVGVASHSGWLMTVFNGVCECNDQSLKEWFQTGEMRSVQVVFEND